MGRRASAQLFYGVVVDLKKVKPARLKALGLDGEDPFESEASRKFMDQHGIRYCSFEKWDSDEGDVTHYALVSGESCTASESGAPVPVGTLDKGTGDIVAAVKELGLRLKKNEPSWLLVAECS